MLKLGSDTDISDIVEHARYRNSTLKAKIHSSESESDVRQSVLSLYDLDLIGNLEKHRIDYWSNELLIEFKYNIDLIDLPNRCRVLAQILHYLYLLFTKHGNTTLPENIALVDKTSFILYDTSSLLKYILIDSYFEDSKRPSSEHVSLERDLRKDPAVTGMKFHTIADYDRIYSELEKRGVYVK